jgi:hypothetical protein
MNPNMLSPEFFELRQREWLSTLETGDKRFEAKGAVSLGSHDCTWVCCLE